MKPPNQIDGAEVLEWAWSGDTPFGVIMYDESNDIATEIFGIAICKYPSSNVIYRFSCDKDWETQQDTDYSSTEEAKGQLPEQYQGVSITWLKNN
ncbi:MAG: hypothetical protein ACRBB3_09065 [Alphaproteobacteria bacterium]